MATTMRYGYTISTVIDGTMQEWARNSVFHATPQAAEAAARETFGGLRRELPVRCEIVALDGEQWWRPEEGTVLKTIGR